NEVSPSAQSSRLVLLLLVSVMIGIVVRAIVVAKAARQAMIYVLLAISAAFVGTVGGALTEFSTRDSTWWIGLCWLVANVAMAAGAAHPAMRHLSHQPRGVRLSPRRLVFLGAALTVTPGLVGLEHLLGRGPDAMLLWLHALAVVPLVIARIAILARLHAIAEGRLAVLAARDELAGLPNRRAVTEHLDALLLRVADGRSPGAAVLFLDLDGFKEVNDAHGHQAGDRVLAEVAARLRGAVRGADVVGRFGGDEFLLVLEGDPDGARAAGLGAVEQALEPSARLGEVTAATRASIGTAVARPGEST
ncbi:MAG TPA: GGDEF domain-containing protein, partial [Actinotalea sp.]|nr:GGDEF domain-containing protein [Actinotalea sp.]